MSKCKIITIANQKGGTGKTTTTWNLGYALAQEGKRVLLCDFDPQGNLSMCFGIEQPETLPVSMHDILGKIIQGKDLPETTAYIQKGDKSGLTLDIIPCNINLAATELNLQSETGGEHTLSELLTPLQDEYDIILIDSSPYLGILTINALAACDEVIIPVSPQLWSATGLTDLLQTITKVKRRINPKIAISGILLTMCDERTTLYKTASELLEETYGSDIRIFNTRIPSTVKVGEANYSSKSVIEHDPNGKAATAYMDFAKEVI